MYGMAGESSGNPLNNGCRQHETIDYVLIDQ